MDAHALRRRHLTQSPPRPLSLYTQLTLLFAGANAQWACFLFTLTLWGLSFGIQQSEVKYLFSQKPNWQNTQGVLEQVENVGGKLSRTKIYRYTFSYTHQGKTLQAHSHADTWEKGPTPRPIEVEYDPDLGLARIKGTRVERYNFRVGIYILLGLFLPLLFLLFLSSELWQNARILRLYRNGIFTRGHLELKKKIGKTVQGQKVYRYEFAFQAQDGKEYLAHCRTHQTALVEDEDQEIIFYDPQDPKNNTVFDENAAHLHINEAGQFDQAGWLSLLNLAIPLLCLTWLILSWGWGYFF